MKIEQAGARGMKEEPERVAAVFYGLKPLALGLAPSAFARHAAELRRTSPGEVARGLPTQTVRRHLLRRRGADPPNEGRSNGPGAA